MSGQLTKGAIAALEKYFTACAKAEGLKPPDEYQLLRAARARQYWLARGYIKLPPYPS